MIALELEKCFDCKKCIVPEPGIGTLIERGMRAVVCRHCVNPACVAACPIGALKMLKDSELSRDAMKCVSCKQCTVACPVGANPARIIDYKKYPVHKINVMRCIKICKKKAISEIEKIPVGWIVVDKLFAVKIENWK